jgi:aminopeptidase YwaD
MGADTYFPGANDNASGVTMMINLAKYFSKPENAPPYSIIFCAFGSEEIGLLGSLHFVEKPLVPLKNIRFLLNLDILGTGVDGITTVNATVYKAEFDRLVKINDKKQLLKQIKPRGEACISDHCFFHKSGVPSFYSYTMGGISEYHNIYDKSETLTLEEFDDLLLLFAEFLGGF